MKLLFFANVRSAIGRAADEIPLGQPASMDDVWRLLIGKYPAIAAFRDVARLSRNEEFADADTTFGDTDVVAVIPPVSGG
ncbi:MAG: MoaD/ThiS family protein [Terrimicrobiaceae bacterium]|nr:MoaD/ThiS family protein [Terrimicrobiaceae bacterium]